MTSAIAGGLAVTAAGFASRCRIKAGCRRSAAAEREARCRVSLLDYSSTPPRSMRGGADATLRRQTVDEFLTLTSRTRRSTCHRSRARRAPATKPSSHLSGTPTPSSYLAPSTARCTFGWCAVAEPDTAVAFLGERVPVAAQPAAVTAERPRPRTSPAAQTPGTTSSPFGFTLNGMFSAHKNAREVFTAVFEELCSRGRNLPRTVRRLPAQWQAAISCSDAR